MRESSNEDDLSLSFNSNYSATYREALEMANNRINIVCTNARSLVEKIKSLITLFEENSLHLALVTETWLSPKHCPPRVMSDLTVGSNLSFIRRDRGSRGGGVAICFDPTRIRMNKFPISQTNKRVELVCATGNCNLTKRKIGAAAIYLPPSMSAADLAISVESLVDAVDKMKTKFPDIIL